MYLMAGWSCPTSANSQEEEDQVTVLAYVSQDLELNVVSSRAPPPLTVWLQGLPVPRPLPTAGNQ